MNKSFTLSIIAYNQNTDVTIMKYYIIKCCFSPYARQCHCHVFFCTASPGGASWTSIISVGMCN